MGADPPLVSHVPPVWHHQQHDLLVLLCTSLLPLGLVLATELLKDRRLLTSIQSRKFLHVCTGPVFVLTWPLYSDNSTAKCIAALLPGLLSIRFALAGLGITREPRLVAGTAVSWRVAARSWSFGLGVDEQGAVRLAVCKKLNCVKVNTQHHHFLRPLHLHPPHHPTPHTALRPPPGAAARPPAVWLCPCGADSGVLEAAPSRSGRHRCTVPR